MSDTSLRRSSGGAPNVVVLWGGLLIAFAIVSASVSRVTGWGVFETPAARAVETLALRFEDEPDGSVAIRNAKDNTALYTIAPATNGFMRATLRGLASERKRMGLGEEAPFLLTYWSDGGMSLDDTTTGRRVALEAFGPTNAQAFSRLFAAHGGLP